MCGADLTEDGISPPAAGNTEGESIPMSKKALREAKGGLQVHKFGTKLRAQSQYVSLN